LEKLLPASTCNPLLYKINIEGNLSVEPISGKDKEIDKNHTKVETEVAKLNQSGLKMISNFNKMGINKIKIWLFQKSNSQF
jgi:hypothetical protein